MDTFTNDPPRRPTRTRTRPTKMNDAIELSRPDREMRGLAMMDAYDMDRRDKNLGYDYTKKTSDMPVWMQYFGKVMFLVQIALLVGAAIVFGGAFQAERNGFEYSDQLRFGEMDGELLYTPYACAAFSVATAVIGCVGVKVRHKLVLIIYMLSLALTLGLAAGSTAQAQADTANIKLYAFRQWREMTYNQEAIYQHEHLCCNFDDIDPCCRWAVGEGECENEYICFDRVRPHLEEQFALIGTCSVLHSIICAVVLFMGFGLLIVLQARTFLESYDGDVPFKGLFAKAKDAAGSARAAVAGKGKVKRTKAGGVRKGTFDNVDEMDMEFPTDDNDYFR